MIRRIFRILILTSVFLTVAQAQAFEWAIASKGEQNDAGQAVCMDADGNSYVTGAFTSQQFVLGGFSLKNTALVATNPLKSDMFLAKMDARGKVLWAMQSIGAGDEKGVDIACDKTGHVVVVGTFQGASATFGGNELRNPTASNVSSFIMRVNALGNVQWVQRAGGKNSTEAYSVSTGPNGDIYVTGSFTHGTTFGGYEHKSKSGNNASVFVAKYAADGNLKWFEQIWGTRPGGQNSTQVGKAIFATEDGQFVYAAGWFRGRSTFGDTQIATNTEPSPSGQMLNLFITKYDANGRGIWTKSVGQRQINFSATPDVTDIVADAHGSVYLTGYFGGEVLFGDVSMRGVASRNGWNHDIFLAKYDKDGNHLWHQSAGGRESDKANSIALTPNGVIITGVVSSLDAKFGDVALPKNLTQTFVASYDANGKCTWATAAKMGLPSNGNGIATNGKTTVITGQFLATHLTLGKIDLKGTAPGNFYVASIR